MSSEPHEGPIRLMLVTPGQESIDLPEAAFRLGSMPPHNPSFRTRGPMGEKAQEPQTQLWRYTCVLVWGNYRGPERWRRGVRPLLALASNEASGWGGIPRSSWA
jgi:hypothetical protein